MFHVKLFIMKYMFSYSFLRTVAHEEFGGFETTEVLRSGWFNFVGVADFSDYLVEAVLAAAAVETEGCGVRVYNFFELFHLLQLSFKTFVEDGSDQLSNHFSDQTSTFVPTGPVKSVELYYSFSVSQIP